MELPAVQLDDLTKAFGPDRGVFGVDLEVAQGQIFGFLGPNGAGKTTALRLILDYLRPDRGTARVLGMDCRKEPLGVRRRVGYLPAEFRLDEQRTGWALLEYLAAYRGPGTLERARSLADRLDVRLEGRIKTYSKGMKQKVALIQALMHDPDLLVLDEPTEGFDPLVQEVFAELLAEARSRGRTVFLSSHVLSEVERMCDRVAIIRDGRLLAVERVETLRAKRLRILHLRFGEDLDAAQLALAGATLRAQRDREATFTFAGDVRALAAGLSALPLEDFTLEPAHLDEVFLEFYR